MAEKNLRDDLLGVIDELRQIPDDLGIRRYSVTLRTRTWPGGKPGLGTPVDVDVKLEPRPKVRLLTAKEVNESGGTYQAGDFKIEKITPKYDPPQDNGRTGYSPSDLTQVVNAPQEDVAIILVGDEGLIECTGVEYHFDRPFNYWMVARRRRVPGG